LNRLKFVLESRGVGNSIERAWQIGTRFGLTASRMERRLLTYADLVARHGARPSLPITARVLARNPHVASNLAAKGVELCVHGLVHTDLTRLAPEAQAEHIEEACSIFRRHGIACEGFRSPYLKYNGATLEAVAKAGLVYDSNMPFWWGPLISLEDLKPHEKDGLERGLRFYSPVAYPQQRSLPRFIGNLVEIPVSLPDDEILVDRMLFPPERLVRVWHEMLDVALARGELLTLQLHPERLTILHNVLDILLEAATSGRQFWIATLHEIATWWRQKVATRLHIEAVGSGVFAVTTASVLRSEVHMVQPATGGTRTLTLPTRITAPRKPLIGVHPDTGSDLRRRIRELGYFIDISVDSAGYAVYVSPGVDMDELQRRMAGLNHPILMDSTWPSPFKAALAVTGDIDCLTFGDFLRRFKED
jgi:peptidoglycan/xylan/chitin deacetylase (PgdA/CDA1 family)